MSRIKEFFKSSMLYFLGSVLSNLVIFLLLPVYTKYFSTDEYGYFDAIRSYTVLITSVAFIQIHTIVLRFMYDFNGKDRDKPVSNALCLFGISTVLTAILIYVLSFFVEVHFLPLVIGFALAECFQGFFCYVARGYGKNVLFAVSGVIATVVNALSNIILIMVFGWNYEALYVSMIISVAVQCVIIEINTGVFRKFKAEHVSLDMLRQMMKLGIPFCLNIAAFWFLNTYSRTVIVDKLGTGYNGIYAVASKFTLVLNVLANCVALSWQEMAFEKGADEKETMESLGKYYTKAGNLYLDVLCYGALLILPAIKIVFPIFVDAEYHSGLSIIPLAVVAAIISIYCSFETSIFSSIKKNFFIFVSATVGAVVNVILVNMFIMEYRLQGVNVALIAGFFVNAVIGAIALYYMIGFKCNLWILVKFLVLFVPAYYIYMNFGALVNIGWVLIVLILAAIQYRKELTGFLKVIKSRTERTDKL